MRLQLSILRHALPSVQIIFTRGTGPASHTKSRSGATIADLLRDVNELVPLESSDGEWGLEDYVVEVAATADQEAFYECLHFQTLDSVLRDDDEVIIRALSSEELQSRRLGGRLQISGDGRHLIDGVVFGKRWIRQQLRPGVVIPPRKKRRLIATDEEDTITRLEQSNSLRALVVADSSDEEEDGDYEDKENIDYGKAVALREDFEDADEESEEEIEVVEEDELQLLLKDAEELSDAEPDKEVEVLERQLKARTRLGKRKRDDVDSAANDPIFEGFSTPVRASRPVDFDDDGDGLLIQSTSQLDSGPEADSVLADVTADRSKQIEATILGGDDETETSDSSSDSALDEPSSDEEDPLAQALAEAEEEPRVRARSFGRHLSSEPQNKKSQLSPQKSSKNPPLKEGSSEPDASDSGDSGSSSEESALSTSSSLSESESTSSSGSEGTSDIDLTSSSDSESEAEADQPKKTARTAAAEFANRLNSLQSASSASQILVAETQQQFGNPPRPPQQSAPGQGLTRTHKKNDRVRMKKKLKTLKEAGELPAHADFSDLKQYEDSRSLATTSTDVLTEELEAAKARLLDGIEALVTEPEPGRPSNAEASQAVVQPIHHTDMSERGRASTPILEKDVVIADAASEFAAAKRSSSAEGTDPKSTSPAKRSKLDVAASRRLLFGSLGLRTPKTPAEEQALRKKLAEKARPMKSNNAPESRDHAQANALANAERTDLWQDKLIVSAVECVRDGVTLPPPPFPFVQNWHKTGKYKLSPVDSALHYDGSGTHSSHSERRKPVDGFAPDVSSIGLQTLQDDLSNPESRTLSFEKETDDMPMPTDFNALAELDRSHLAKGTIIAYKEIYVGAETNFQPEISSYRVAKVDYVNVDGIITVVLSKRDRAKDVQFDPETGEATSNNFEIAGSQDEDDGVRELDFAFMLEPKLVEAAKLQVPESTAVSSVPGGSGDALSQQKGDDIVPESIEEAHHTSKPDSAKIVVEQIEIDTPRRKEITTMIKEAGFESAMGQDLLETLPAPHTGPQERSQPTQDEQRNATFSSDPRNDNDQGPSPSNEVQTSYLETSRVAIEKSLVEDWNSSPLHPAADLEPGTKIERDFSSPPEVINPSSSPPVSPQLTVDYPHVSQMNLRSSAGPLDESTRLSSHQDAQQVPALPPNGLSSVISNQNGEMEPASGELNFHDDNNNLESLQSEIPQTQSQDQEVDNESVSHSFLGTPGYDGHGSSYHESDDDPATSDSNSSLPSLRELTSSQKRKITANGAKQKKISPPPSKKTHPKKVQTRRTTLIAGDGGGDNDDEEEEEDVEAVFPAPSSPVAKGLESQVEKLRSSSQAPLRSQVVDLTVSSDPVSPDDSNSEYGVMRPRKARRLAQVNGGSKAKTRASTLGPSVSDVGIGTKKFLITKKTRSQTLSGAKDGGYF